MTDAFVGIDVAFAKRKFLPVSICTWHDGRLEPRPLLKHPRKPPRGQGNVATLDDDCVARFALQAVEYVAEVCHDLGLTPRRIGIDAPRLPRSERATRRAAEIAMDRAGINCFTTPSASEFEDIRARVRHYLAAGGAQGRMPHANQLWMLVGFRLFREFSGLCECIEVFPQATVRVLGSGQLHKFKRGAVEAQLAEVSRHTGWPSGEANRTVLADIAFGPSHDCLDAYLSAWVAALDEDKRVAFGSPPDDVIWTPREGEARFEKAPIWVSEPEAPAAPPIPAPERPAAVHARLCPACGRHEFKRWPFGWDAHAAHRCSGLQAVDPEERKHEFRRRYDHLFGGRNHN